MTSKGVIAAAFITATATIIAALVTAGIIKPGPEERPESISTRREEAPKGIKGPKSTKSPSKPKLRPGISVDPSVLELCAGCSAEVRVTSTGTAALEFGDIDFEPEEVASGFQVDETGCAGQSLAKGEGCTLIVSFHPPADGTSSEASLAIHQNLPGDATYISAQGTVTEPEPVPEVS